MCTAIHHGCLYTVCLSVDLTVYVYLSVPLSVYGKKKKKAKETWRVPRG